MLYLITGCLLPCKNVSRLERHHRLGYGGKDASLCFLRSLAEDLASRAQRRPKFSLSTAGGDPWHCRRSELSDVTVRTLRQVKNAASAWITAQMQEAAPICTCNARACNSTRASDALQTQAVTADPLVVLAESCKERLQQSGEDGRSISLADITEYKDTTLRTSQAS